MQKKPKKRLEIVADYDTILLWEQAASESGLALASWMRATLLAAVKTPISQVETPIPEPRKPRSKRKK